MSVLEKTNWTKIILAYKDLTFLWDKNDIHYTNKAKRNQGLKMLFNMYKEFEANGTIDGLKKKIDNMRTTYKRELKKVRTSKLANPNDVYQPTLWYFDLFSFLQPGEHATSLDESQDTKSHFTTLDLYDEESHQSLEILSNPQSESEDSDAGNHHTSYLPKRIHAEKDQTSHTEQRLKIKRRRTSSGNNYFEAIGKSIGCQLMGLDQHQLAIAEKLISEAIFFARMGRLTEEASISLSDPLNEIK